MPTCFPRLILKGCLCIFLCIPSLVLSASVDSLYISKYKKIKYFEPDSIFWKYAHLNFNKSIDDLYEYYDIVSFMSPEKQDQQVEKMRQAAKKYNSSSLMYEADFMQALFMPDNQLGFKIEQLKKIEQQAKDRNDLFMVLREMEVSFGLYWSSAQYAKAFHQAHMLDKELLKTSENEYPRWKYCYYLIGEAYFFFQDYEKALPYLRKATTPSKFFFDTSNLQARNTIGIYYNLRGQNDSAEYYFRSAFFSTDRVRMKSIYDAISLGNIGHSLSSKGDYDNAISYLEPALSRLVMDQEYSLASNIAVSLGECYLAKGDLKKAKELIDASSGYIVLGNRGDLRKSIYYLMCKYYAKSGKHKLSEMYLDSTIIANKEYEKKYSSLIILRSEQEVFETENKAKDEQMKLVETNYKNKIYFSLVASVLIFIFMVIFIQLYRKNKDAYQALVQKSQEWAEAPVEFVEEISTSENEEIEEINEKIEEKTETIVSTKIEVPDKNVSEEVNEPKKAAVSEAVDKEILKLMKRVNELLTNKKLYRDFDLTLELLAKNLDVNRNYLSKAINKTTGKNFNTFINEYRVKEAIKVMSDKKSDLISIDSIALEVGFGNRISFYQAFKKITGLSPSDFRNNKKN